MDDTTTIANMPARDIQRRERGENLGQEHDRYVGGLGPVADLNGEREEPRCVSFTPVKGGIFVPVACHIRAITEQNWGKRGRHRRTRKTV